MSAVGLVAIVVDEYDRAIEHYINDLGFNLVEDLDQGNKRWVVVAPPGAPGTPVGTGIVLARATTDEQRERIGDQTGGRVSFFLYCDDFHVAYAAMIERGVHFEEAPRDESYGRVAVFRDLYGNRWDLLEPSGS